MKRHISVFAAALAASAPFAAQAAPTINITNYSFPNGKRTGTIHHATSPFNNRSVYIGQFKLDGKELPGNNPVSFLTFCVDIFNVLAVPRLFEVTSLTQMYTGDRWTNINKILTNVGPINSADKSAAVQMALWEVANETATSFNINSGAFSITGDNLAARNLAQGYLSDLGNYSLSTTQRAKLLFNADNQSQVFLAAVPEPATWAMLILGFGAIGFALRRAKVRTKVAFA